ncbi:MAG: hypothetical protein HKN76_05155 [Saprospiraceae bacterium]|nr:hypothetical protein [Saprospiraceae bacterium]
MKNVFLIELELNFSFRNQIQTASRLMNQMLADGQIQIYGISRDLNRMWITTVADSELEVWELVSHLPVESIMDPVITTLNTYNQAINMIFPSVSLN